jgi:cytochrome c oxidase subunit 2
VIFVAVEGVIVFTAFRYRRKPGDDELPPQTHGNNLVEVIWTIVPTIIVVFLFALSWQTLNTVEAKVTSDVHVRAVAARFQWSFEYLDGEAADAPVLFTQSLPVGDDGGLVLPVGEPVTIDLRSQDVIHAFYVPKFLFKRDVVPGQTNRFQFTVDATEATDGHPNVFGGQCAELCGTGHRTMLFNVIAMSPGDFDTWLQALIAKNNATPPPAPSGAPAFALTAHNVAFDKTSLDVQAGQPFVIDFKNTDAGTPHDVDIRQSDKTTVVQDQPVTEGGAESTYTYNALQPGTYVFICSIHPTLMSGTLTVH